MFYEQQITRYVSSWHQALLLWNAMAMTAILKCLWGWSLKFLVWEHFGFWDYHYGYWKGLYFYGEDWNPVAWGRYYLPGTICPIPQVVPVPEVGDQLSRRPNFCLSISYYNKNLSIFKQTIWWSGVGLAKTLKKPMLSRSWPDWGLEFGYELSFRWTLIKSLSFPRQGTFLRVY